MTSFKPIIIGWLAFLIGLSVLLRKLFCSIMNRVTFESETVQQVELEN